MSNTQTDDDRAIFNFMHSAAAVLQIAVVQARRDDPAAVDAMNRALAAGAMISLKATLVPSTDIARLAVEFVDVAGDVHNVMSCELHHEVMQ